MNSFVKYNNELLMYVANRTNQVQNITIPLTSSDGTMSIGEYDVQSSSGTQSANSGNGTITISLPASSAEVYTITPENSSDLPDVELSEEDKLIVSRARKVQRFLSQPFTVAEQFTGLPGKYVPLSDTIQSFKEILEGKHDDVPESYFLNAGSIEDVVAKCK